jgi:CheY-like chemotaxis protein
MLGRHGYSPLSYLSTYILGLIGRVFHSARSPASGKKNEVTADREGLLQTFERIGRALRREDLPALDALAHALSHELRGPLAAISMWGHVVGLEGCDEETRERAVLAIESSVRAQSRLIEDLLDLAAALAGTMHLALAPTPIAEAVAAAIEANRAAAEANDVGVALTDDDGGLVVRGDGERLAQALKRVLARAIEGAPVDGRVEVVVSRAAGGARVAVSSVGSGQGAPEGDAGISVGVARHVVEMHGGTLTASEVDGRPAFTVDLPITRASALTVLRGARVLVVDDEAPTREGVATVLVQFGAQVRVAGSAGDAMNVVDEWAPHAIVSDLAMPGEDGVAFMERLRARPKERGGAIPAVAFTANVSADARTRAFGAGYQRLLVKPLDASTLALAIDELLQAEYARRP